MTKPGLKYSGANFLKFCHGVSTNDCEFPVFLENSENIFYKNRFKSEFQTFSSKSESLCVHFLNKQARKIFRFCFNILLSADKNAKKPKILKSSVWEAQAKGISSTSLRDTVSTHTASESTRLV
jgi:hypothetical protein